MANGRLKIGSDYLKIGLKYLRIGPAASDLPFFPVKQNAVGSPTTSVDMSFVIPGSNDAILILAVHTPQTANGLGTPSFSVPGDLTWTSIDTFNDSYVVLGNNYQDTYEWFWAALPAGSTSPVSVSADCSIDPGLGGMFSTLSYIEGIDMVTPIDSSGFQASAAASSMFDGLLSGALPSLAWYFKARPNAPDGVTDDTYLPGPSDAFSDGIRWGLAYDDALDPSGGQFPLSNAYGFYNLTGGTFTTTVGSPSGTGSQRTFMIQLTPA